MHRLPPRFAAALAALILAVGLLMSVSATAASPAPAPAAAPPTDPAASDVIVVRADEEMTVVEAVVLGLVEGITEYLPVSSTGHLVVAERLLDMADEGTAKEALDAYTVIIQFGAIIAVLVLYRKRVGQLFAGLVGRSVEGRQLLLCVLGAFVPAAVIGLAFGDLIDKHLLKPGPVAAAWIVGGIVILLIAKRLRPGSEGGTPLDSMPIKTAFFIGCAQTAALWPGTSRSLVTIVAAVLLGMSLAAAVEFSFLLGLVTLTAASLLAAMKDGDIVVDTYGVAMPALGIFAAFVSAALAIGSFVNYLAKRDLSGFGWYRIGAGIVAVGLMAAGAI